MLRTLGLGVNFGTKPKFQFARIFNRLPLTTPSGRPFGPSPKYRPTGPDHLRDLHFAKSDLAEGTDCELVLIMVGGSVV